MYNTLSLDPNPPSPPHSLTPHFLTPSPSLPHSLTPHLYAERDILHVVLSGEVEGDGGGGERGGVVSVFNLSGDGEGVGRCARASLTL